MLAIGLGGILNSSPVVPHGGWRENWPNKGRPSSNVRDKSHVVGRIADGRQEIFAIGDDKTLWQTSLVAPNNGWSAWKTLRTLVRETSFTDQCTVGSTQDGRQEGGAVGSDGNVWQIWHTAPNGGWSDWGIWGQPLVGIRRADRITVGSHEDRRQERFIMGETTRFGTSGRWRPMPDGATGKASANPGTSLMVPNHHRIAIVPNHSCRRMQTATLRSARPATKRFVIDGRSAGARVRTGSFGDIRPGTRSHSHSLKLD